MLRHEATRLCTALGVEHIFETTYVFRGLDWSINKKHTPLRGVRGGGKKSIQGVTNLVDATVRIVIEDVVADLVDTSAIVIVEDRVADLVDATAVVVVKDGVAHFVDATAVVIVEHGATDFVDAAAAIAIDVAAVVEIDIEKLVRIESVGDGDMHAAFSAVSETSDFIHKKYLRHFFDYNMPSATCQACSCGLGTPAFRNRR